MSQNKLLIDVGSTYFKICANGKVEQYFRDFNKDILMIYLQNVEILFQNLKR